MFQYVIFKVDNKYYLYSVHNDFIVEWEYGFNKLFKSFVDFVQYQIKYCNLEQRQFTLHIRKF